MHLNGKGCNKVLATMFIDGMYTYIIAKGTHSDMHLLVERTTTFVHPTDHDLP